MLELIGAWKGVKQRRKTRWLLEGADVALPPGRRIALLGPDRGDNQTVLRILSGIEAPDRGVMRCVGLACWPFDSTAFVDPGGTLRQNATFLARLYGFDAREIIDIAKELSGVKLKKDATLRSCTGVEKRQIALGLTLAIQFDWYFLDEKLPTFAPPTTAAMESACADRFSRAGIVWATTKPETVEDYCDAGMVLDRGRLTFYNEASDAFEAYRSLSEARDAKRQ